MYGLSGDAPDGLARDLHTGLPAGSRLLDPIPEPDDLPGWLSEADLSSYAQEFDRTGFTGALNRYRNVDRDWHELPTLGLTTVEQPTLFITGEQDTATQLGRLDIMRQQVPNLWDPIVLPGCGHWVQQERPDQVNRHVTDFLHAAAPADHRL